MVIDDLQRFEQRPADVIRDEISRQFVDVTNVQAEHKYDSSVFPLDASHKLFFSAKKMVIAAAAATLRRRGYFGHSVPQRARDQARTVLVGHTRPGSYIVPVISRAHVLDAPLQDGSQLSLVAEVEESAFDRRTVVTLSRGLETLHEIAVSRDRVPTNREVNDGVGEGLSYEMCDSVIRSLKDQTVEEFVVGVQWAPGVPAPRSSYTGAISFPTESLDVIRRVAKGLRQDIQDREQVIFGWVEMLSSKAEDAGGRVHVHAMVDGRRRIIRMTLNPEDYEKAVSSHKHRSVMVRGDLHLEEGKQPYMDVHAFEVEETLPVARRDSAT